MSRIFLALLLAGLPLVAQAQTIAPLPSTPPSLAAASQGYKDCLISAIVSEDIYKDATGIQFRCFGQAAENWFNQLPGGREVKDTNGIFVARYFDGPGYCAHQTRNAKGEPVSSYLCAIDRPPLR
ncbi:MAG: hypothetical protein KDJ30_05980 [Rhodoblastus sp.]|nr:hypothetical protein [Rhodoblastus sp.]